MKVTVNVTPEGLAQELEATPARLTVAASNALQLTRVYAQAKALCPVDTGALRDSIRVEHPDAYTATLIAGGAGYTNPVTGRPVDYARHVHNGTRWTPPRPFLTQAVLSERGRVGREILLTAAGVT